MPTPPASIYFDAFYFPKFTYQRYGVEMISTRWNGTTRDTLMRVTRHVSAVVDSNNSLKPGWTTQQLDLGMYADTLLPDSATIIITLDAVAPLVNNTLLLIDHIHFGKWRTGLTESEPPPISVTAWPNPADGFVRIKGNGDGIRLSDAHVFDCAGRRVKSLHEEPAAELQIDLSDLESGIYLLTIKAGGQLKTLRVVVQH